MSFASTPAMALPYAPHASASLRIPSTSWSAPIQKKGNYLTPLNNNLYNHHEIYPAPQYSDGLLAGAACNLQCHALPNVHDDLPQAIHPILRAQSRLGWDQLYHGRINKSWALAINQLNPHPI